MANTWIMAKTVDGPLDGLFFAVIDTQETIVGINDMTEDESYAKDESSVREFVGTEQKLAELLFDRRNLPTKYCEFIYSQ